MPLRPVPVRLNYPFVPRSLFDAVLPEIAPAPRRGAILRLGAVPCRLHYHERFDGSGYPDGLAGAYIPLGARVLAVADAWDAMTSNRAYRHALAIERVYDQIEHIRGVQFDPRVVDAFLRMLAKRPDLARLHTETAQEIDAPSAEPVPA